MSATAVVRQESEDESKMTVATRINVEMTVAKWIKLLEHAGVTKQACKEDKIGTAIVTGCMVAKTVDLASEFDFLIYIPEGDPYITKKQWREIEEGLNG